MSYHDNPSPAIVLGILLLIGALVGGISLAVAATTIDPGHRAVVYNQWDGREDTYTIGEGFHWVNPYVYDVYELDTRNQLHRVTTEGVTVDQQVITTEVAVRYHINKHNITDIIFEFRTGVEEMCIDPAIQESVKSVVAKRTALASSTIERPQVKAEITAQLQERAAECYITISEVDVTDFDYSEAVNLAIEEKQRKEQELLAYEFEQDKKRVAAKAEYEASLLKANATRAEADAAAYKATVIQSTLTPEYMQYLQTVGYYERWNGMLPQTVLGNDTNTFVSLP